MEWLGFNRVATLSAAGFYLFLLSLAIPTVRARAGEVFSLPHPSTRQEIAALDAYRGAAAALVTMAHIWVFCRPVFDATQQRWWKFLDIGGNKAVPIFVMLSGFLIYRAVKNIHTLDDLRRYAQRRFLRIYPVYLFTVMLGYLASQAAFDWPNLISQVFMVRSISQAYLNFINPPAWSLFVEVLFYALLPVWYAVVRTRPMSASALGFIVLLFADPLASRELWLWKYFFVGIFVSELLERYGAHISRRNAFFFFLAGCVFLCLDFRSGARYDWFDRLGLVPGNPAGYTVGLAAAFSLILIGTLCSPRIGHVMSRKPLRALGAISYSLFLIHPFFILAVFPKFRFDAVGSMQSLLEPAVHAPAWYAPLIMFPGALAWAMVCFVLVERPFLLRRPGSVGSRLPGPEQGTALAALSKL